MERGAGQGICLIENLILVRRLLIEISTSRQIYMELWVRPRLWVASSVTGHQGIKPCNYFCLRNDLPLAMHISPSFSSSKSNISRTSS